MTTGSSKNVTSHGNGAKPFRSYFFATASHGRLPQKAARAAIVEHVGHLTGQADMYAAKDYVGADEMYRMGYQHTYDLGLTLANALLPLADRATQELRASGETARKRNPSTLLDLTPMELKVARLVSTGLSNKDVAAQCWVSPRTVAFHLRNVFTKVGVSSRTELAQLDFT